MKKKGFTLVELLIVLVLMVAITLVMAPKINNMFKKIEDSKYKNFLNNLYLSTEAYIQQNLKNYPNIKEENKKIYVYYSDLIASKYLRSNLYNPKDKEFVKNQDNTIEVYLNSDSEYKYRIIKGRFYENGHIIYFNPVTGLKCYDYVLANSNTSVKSGCMKWYTFLDNELAESKIKLILDHNTTAGIAWNSSGTNVSGPNEVLTKLKEDTDSWVGVADRTDNYTLNNGTADYTISYNTYKARLISAGEIAGIIGIKSFNEMAESSIKYFETMTETVPNPITKSFAWLFDYTNNCTDYGCNISDTSTYGYWTSTAKPEITASSWIIHSNGRLDRYLVNNNTYFGIRPVITVSKSVIK